MDNTLYYLWLNLRLGAGSRAAVRLVRAAGGAREVWEDLSDELAAAAKVKPSVMEKLRRGRDLSECDEILAKCAKWHVTVLTPDMDEYPRSLLCIMDYPMVLFCRGTLPDFNKRFFCAVVGTREMTDYGRRAAYDIGLGLGDGGAVTVSGLALGIDGMAIAGALAVGGATVGVLGCGIDIVYPPEHKDLFSMVTEKGAVITEYIPGSPPSGHHFPVRNRIISGLCQATAVIEGDSTSGSLITAKHAIFQGREVFALPGNVDEPCAEGPNSLIREGATVMLTANDIISRYEFLYPHSLKPARVISGGADTSALAIDLARVATAAAAKGKHYGKGVYGGKGSSSKKHSSRKGRGAEGSRGSTASDGYTGNTAPAPTAESAAPAAEARTKTRVSMQNSADVETAARTAAEKTSRMAFCHIDMLGKKEQDVYYAMKPGTPTLPDEILKDVYPIGDILASLTLLEIAGAVEAGAGGYFIRCGTDGDDLMEAPE